MKISIFDLSGEYAVSYKKSQILYEELKKSWAEKEIILDFKNVSIVASPFFNGSIGLLMEKETRKNIEEKIKFENITQDTLDTLKAVLDNAENFYKKNLKI